MDPTKTISYRRWRNKLAGKGFSTFEPIGDQSFRASAKAKRSPWEDAVEGDRENMKLRMFAFNRRMDEMETRKLMKNLEREYRKAESFRKEKVAKLKQSIKNGKYRVSGKEVVEKWFPEVSASKSR